MKLHWSLICLVLPLWACTQLAVEPTLIEETPRSLWQQRQQKLNTFVDWNLKGRLAVQAGPRSDRVSLVWKRNGNQQEIHLLGPFGGGQIEISEKFGTAILRDGVNKEIRGRSTEEVLFNVLAWPVPFSEMIYWVRGLPAPGRHEGIGFDYDGRARHLTQNGWKIEYTEYRIFQGLELPSRIVIRALPGAIPLNSIDRKTLDSISVKLIIGSWNGVAKAG